MSLQNERQLDYAAPADPATSRRGVVALAIALSAIGCIVVSALLLEPLLAALYDDFSRGEHASVLLAIVVGGLLAVVSAGVSIREMTELRTPRPAAVTALLLSGTIMAWCVMATIH